MKKTFLQLLFTVIYFDAFTYRTITKYFFETDKDHSVPWDFYYTGGRNSSKWTKIAVPSNWEQQGFGTYNYSLYQSTTY